MPIFEFFCPDCNTVYNFLSRKPGNKKIPPCPGCKKDSLKKEVTAFATLSGSQEQDSSEIPGVDDASMGKAMEFLEKEAGKVSEDNPEEAVGLMRKFSDVLGMKLGPGMEEALSRIESGENPEQVEQEMGELFSEEDPFSFDRQGKRASTIAAPVKDETLYEM